MRKCSRILIRDPTIQWRNESWEYWVSKDSANNHKLARSLKICYKLALLGSITAKILWIWCSHFNQQTSYGWPSSLQWRLRPFAIKELDPPKKISLPSLMDSSFSFFTFCLSVLWPEGVCSQRQESARTAIQMLSWLQIPAGGSTTHQTWDPPRKPAFKEWLTQQRGCLENILAQQQNRTQTLMIQWRKCKPAERDMFLNRVTIQSLSTS